MVAKFLKKNEDYLRDALVLVIGDHGLRFGPTLKTYVGQLETASPGIHIYMPPKLVEHYPHLPRYLDHNRER